MIQITHYNIGELTDGLSSINRSKEECRQLDQFEQIRFSILDLSHNELSTLLKEVLSNLLGSYKVYLVYVESKAQPKSRVRTHKKMFYQERKLDHFGPSDIYEQEVEMAGGKSLLVGALRLSSANAQYIVDHLITANFRFGYLVKKGKKSFSKNAESFLEDVAKLLVEDSKLTRIDFIALLLSKAKKNRHILKLPVSVNEKTYLDFLIWKEDEEVSRILSELEHKFREAVEN